MLTKGKLSLIILVEMGFRRQVDGVDEEIV